MRICPVPSPVPLQPALFPTLYHPSLPLQSSRPRLARPFDMVYASGIQMTAFARAEECPTISAWLRPPTTTRLHHGIRSLVSSFFSSPPYPSSCAESSNMLSRPYIPSLSYPRSFPLYTSRIFKGRPRKPIQIYLHLFRLIRSRDSPDRINEFDQIV